MTWPASRPGHSGEMRKIGQKIVNLENFLQSRTAKKSSLPGENRKPERSPSISIKNGFELTCNNPAASLIKKATNARHF
jgi:hypothetical protein